MAIAVVGAGASGILVAAALTARDPAVPIVLVDRRRIDAGLAHGAPDPSWLLNVRAGAMGGDPDRPEAFVEWARRDGAGPLQGHEFLPREAYGRYLRSLVGTAGGVTRCTGEVSRVRRRGEGWAVELAGGEPLPAASVVLALGNPSARPLAAGDVAGAVDDPLEAGRLARIGDGDRVAIVGTGLTAVDLGLVLADRLRHPVVMVSRSGMFPLTHCVAGSACCAEGNGEVPARFTRALETGGPGDVLGAFRRELAARPDRCWQSRFDQLIRPRFAALWARWDDAERSRFVHRLASPFDRHRHRMAPEVADRLSAAVAAGRIRVHRGTVAGIREVAGGVEVVLHGSGVIGPVQWALNATGPDLRATAYGPVVAGLIASGAARAGWGGLGIDVDDAGRVLAADGSPTPGLYALGPLCRGTRWETTAIAEIRDQAAVLATLVAAQPSMAR